MRRIAKIATIAICVFVVLAGCGQQDVSSVVKQLEHTMKNLKSYQGEAIMTLHTGQQPQAYDVTVWYQAPHYYRIALTNPKKDITQIVLRNDDGVFVLTPHLNKSFRFQSEWPDNQGQVYLYQSLMQGILADNSRQFKADKDAYQFDVLANYQNGSLSRQKIWLNKKDYAPLKVEVMDTNEKIMVEVKFTKFDFGKAFEKDDFDMQRNMTGWSLETWPTLTESDSEDPAPEEDVNRDPSADTDPETDANADPSAEAEQEEQADLDKESAAVGLPDDFGIMEPEYTPDGVVQQTVQEVALGDTKGIMLRYTGTYNYTLVESRPQDQAVALVRGTVLDLGFTIGHLTGQQKRTLTWTYEGIEYRLSSDDLPESEMVRIAQSIQDQTGK